MRTGTLLFAIFLIGFVSLASLVILLADLWSAEGSLVELQHAASYLGNPAAAAVSALLFLGGVAMAAYARKTWAVAVLIPSLVLASAPIIIGPPQGWNAPRGVIAAFTSDFEIDGVKQPCPPGWKVFDDLAGKFPLGAGSGSLNGVPLTPRVPGQKGGAEKHQLTKDEMPAHDHGRIHGGKGGVSAHAEAATKYHADGNHPMVSEGKNAPHNNMPPYYVVQYCVLE
ncbi:hypothetical protein AB9K35_07690 [Leisingera sp. XS_AS12]|uniref:hypothetical protein n=1 Tax=Leisingera sp. XS_AS12 TaxID=3241294 RepID=UPI0035147E75